MRAAATGRQRAPKPPRPLGQEGRATWRRIWALHAPWIHPQRDLEHVMLLCEAMDERVRLRVLVLRDESWRERAALRNLDAQITDLLSSLGLNPVQRNALSVGEEATGRLAELRALRSVQ